jgi:predicted MPP superfamily phosphohydrolase
MYVSRGIGMIGIPVRFLATPEVAVISVSPQ